MNMKILVIGAGGREHALCHMLKQSKGVKELFAAPGNGGISQIATILPYSTTDFENIANFCQNEKIDLVVVGPEDPLSKGIVDFLGNKGIVAFGPSKKAAQLESSKIFTKELCIKYNIPTAKYQKFSIANEAKAYAARMTPPIVVKADGLASGKGVVIAANIAEANRAIDKLLEDFGKIIIEEFLEGEEVSFFALSDGNKAIYIGSAQDHKRVGDGDVGANTGGMGTYSPVPAMNKKLEEQVMKEIIAPTIEAMKQEDCLFKGVLFAGLILTKDGPKLLEYNARFGDPETQVLLPRIKGDLLGAIIAVAKGDLGDIKLEVDENQSALCVVMASRGYPGSYQKNTLIKNIENAGGDNVIIFHAGTMMKDGEYYAIGGRVLGVTSIASNIKKAQALAYESVAKIDWENGFCRKDIGWRAVKK